MPIQLFVKYPRVPRPPFFLLMQLPPRSPVSGSRQGQGLLVGVSVASVVSDGVDIVLVVGVVTDGVGITTDGVGILVGSSVVVGIGVGILVGSSVVVGIGVGILVGSCVVVGVVVTDGIGILVGRCCCAHTHNSG